MPAIPHQPGMRQQRDHHQTPPMPYMPDWLMLRMVQIVVFGITTGTTSVAQPD
jgi:hypothetical protein